MKTDAIFYDIFQEFPSILFDLIGQSNTNTNAYKFIAPEIKQRSFRLDGVFSPLEGFGNEPLYFVEVQFYKDEEFYDRLFTSIFLYFSQYKPVTSEWYAIVIYDKHSNEISCPLRYHALLEPHLRCFYLDELEVVAEESLGVGIVRLVVETNNKAPELAKQLIDKARLELADVLTQRKVLEFIEEIIVYKFPNSNREEIETMLNLNLLKQTRVYQEAKEEAKEEVKQEAKEEVKLELVTKLVQKGLSIQEIAELLELDVEIIRKSLN
ncbi:MAG: Rpn family recombination-promoting nuclease/putative transposase [Nostoc sp. NMS1]|uniref:Rpn family recombination-promoting nuclease/putative transposase n=1 Tax=unclassified Nostoc TaxID=2593658 RepID=UPI0025CD921B|nr:MULTISPECIES: Rpn family recombination-promoting nuclease/putative transposase [unclassified Nostoc]MBN3908867.1 Rpn family recombination-promoting nuclease/putative transposase [Nostoc sp. NMS1]MBN3990770.1 Rpn family recombination-promoting nuclease/putative transposase [Nostoc sp. NMS2]